MAEARPGDADRRWAAEHAPRLLAEARAQALRDARARLRERLADALIDAAGVELQDAPVQRPDPDPDPDPDAPPERAALGLWVYGVMRGDAPDPQPVAGVDERHDIELVRHAGLAAVASAVPLEEFQQDTLEEQLEDLQRLSDLARAHERVLDETLRLGPVVPLRICTIYESADGVREMLERESRSLADALRRLSGNVEWGVKAYLAPGGDAAAQTVAGSGDPGAGPASGVDYLARKRDARDAAEVARQAADATVELIHRRLSGHALAAVLSPPQDPRLSGDEREMVLNAAYLVPEVRTEEFRSLVSNLATRHAADGLALELTGPWPAYHFAGSQAAG